MYTLFARNQYTASQVKVQFIKTRLHFYGQGYLFSVHDIKEVAKIPFKTEENKHGMIYVHPPQRGSNFGGVYPYDIIVEVKCSGHPVFGIETKYIQEEKMTTIIS